MDKFKIKIPPYSGIKFVFGQMTGSSFTKLQWTDRFLFNSDTYLSYSISFPRIKKPKKFETESENLFFWRIFFFFNTIKKRYASISIIFFKFHFQMANNFQINCFFFFFSFDAWNFVFFQAFFNTFEACGWCII